MKAHIRNLIYGVSGALVIVASVVSCSASRAAPKLAFEPRAPEQAVLDSGIARQLTTAAPRRPAVVVPRRNNFAQVIGEETLYG